jgi:DNA-binding protein YbaB
MTSPVSTDPGQTDPALDRWIADAEQMAARYQQLSTDVSQVSVTESTPDGLIRVTVNSAGLVTDLRISERVTGMPGPRVAAGVLMAMRRAQSRIAGRVAELMRATVGQDKAMMDAVLTNYQTLFPAPPEPARPIVDEVRIGGIEPAPVTPHAPDPGPARVRRPAPRADDWDGGTGSFLEEVDR